jgi:hypothetical protein
MRFLPVTFYAFFSITWYASADDSKPGTPFPDKIAEVDDNHGNVMWKSSASKDKESENWDYSRYVTNRSKDRRCRFEWKFGANTIKTMLPAATGPSPVSRRVSRELDPDTPKPIDGTMKYNGGVAPGDGTKEAPVWTCVQKTASKGTRGTAELGFDLDGFYEVTITGVVSPTEKTEGGKPVVGVTILQYSLTLDGYVEKMLDNVTFRWTAIDTPELNKTLESVKDYDYKSRAFVIKKKLNKSGEQMVADVRFSYELSAGVYTTEKKEGNLEILNRKTGEVLASTPMPALVPAPRK